MIISKQIRCVVADGETVEYELVRKNIAKMYLRVKKDGRIVVTANRYFTLREADAFVIRSLPYIEKRLEALDNKKIPPMFLPTASLDGRTVLLGKEMPIRLKTVKKGFSVDFLSDEVVISSEEGIVHDEEKLKRRFEKALLSYTKEVLTEVSERIYPLYEAYGVAHPDLRFRAMTSCWGVCHYRKNYITLNTYLIHSEMAAIEEVVMHEYTHFLVPNHSRAFYEIMERNMPDYRARKKKLIPVWER